MRIFETVVFSVIVGVALANNVGDKCTSNSQCSAAKSYCAIASPTCGAGVCSCIPSYSLDNDGNCKRSVVIGAKCSGGDLCTAENSGCQGGTCQCNQGYKVGLKGTDCVSTLKTERYNGKCYDSVQCYYNMVCLNNQCTCYTGYKVIGDYQCQERAVGDSCANDDDCSRTPNTVCSNGVCSCQGGYKQVQYMLSSSKNQMGCIPAGESQVKEGGSCNTTVGASGTALCAKPFVCTQCDASGMKCGRVVPLYSSAKSPVSVVATTLFLVASSFVLRQRFSA